jgi:TusA-related sulfurtransferase
MDIRLLGGSSYQSKTNTTAMCADRTLDITRETCPMTYVRVRLALDGMAPAETLLVLLTGEDPHRNVPRMARQQGHLVLSDVTDDAGVTRLLLRKG